MLAGNDIMQGKRRKCFETQIATLGPNALELDK